MCNQREKGKREIIDKLIPMIRILKDEDEKD